MLLNPICWNLVDSQLETWWDRWISCREVAAKPCWNAKDARCHYQLFLVQYQTSSTTRPEDWENNFQRASFLHPWELQALVQYGRAPRSGQARTLCAILCADSRALGSMLLCPSRADVTIWGIPEDHWTWVRFTVTLSFSSCLWMDSLPCSSLWQENLLKILFCWSNVSCGCSLGPGPGSAVAGEHYGFPIHFPEWQGWLELFLPLCLQLPHAVSVGQLCEPERTDPGL